MSEENVKIAMKRNGEKSCEHEIDMDGNKTCKGTVEQVFDRQVHNIIKSCEVTLLK